MKKLLISILLFVSYNASAMDISKFESTCKDIGFKKKTDAYAECVIELITREKNANKTALAAKQIAVEKEQQIRRDTEIKIIQQRNYDAEQARVAELQRQRQAEQKLQQEKNEQAGINALAELLGTITSKGRNNMNYNSLNYPKTINCSSYSYSLSRSVDTTCTQW